MEKTSCIYWFSGTGNSLYAAKKVSSALGDLPLVQMTGKAPESVVGGEGETVGFVFPSYYGNLPRAVRAYIEKLAILPGTYLFAIVTMGAVGQGSVREIQALLANKGLVLQYGRGVLMPANYIIKYNPADASKSEKRLQKVEEQLALAAADIKSKEQTIKKLPVTAKGLYQNIAALDVPFSATDACISCGVCQKVCPVENIQLENGKPMWLHHCEHCVACISWCPVKAIEYGGRTANRRRYRNPKISVNELFPNK